MVLDGCKAELSYGAASGIPVVGGTQLMVQTDRHAHHDTPLNYSGVVGAEGRAVPVVGSTQFEVQKDRQTDRHAHHDTPLRYSGVVGGRRVGLYPSSAARSSR